MVQSIATAFDLTGGVALVTGGNGGIGRGIAIGLAQAGADIAIAAREDQRTAAVVAEIRALGRRAVGIPCDVTQAADRAHAVAATVQALGPLTILVNNAGIVRGGEPATLAEEDWDAVTDTNLTSVFLLSQCAYPALVAAGGGRIINIASGYAVCGAVYVTAYAASKGGIIQLTRSLAAAWARDNIQVNAIIPGWIRSAMTDRASADNPGIVERILSRTPAGRIGEPEDLAGVAVFLASRSAAFITGEAITVDGGLLTSDVLVDFRERSPRSTQASGAGL